MIQKSLTQNSSRGPHRPQRTGLRCILGPCPPKPAKYNEHSFRNKFPRIPGKYCPFCSAKQLYTMNDIVCTLSHIIVIIFVIENCLVNIDRNAATVRVMFGYHESCVVEVSLARRCSPRKNKFPSFSATTSFPIACICVSIIHINLHWYTVCVKMCLSNMLNDRHSGNLTFTLWFRWILMSILRYMLED